MSPTSRWNRARRSVKRRRRKPLSLESLEPRQLLAADVVISEFMARNVAGFRDGDGSSPDWIELYNPSEMPIDLEGYRLTDEAADRSKWVLPSVVLDAGKYLVVFASGKETDNYVDAGGNLHTNFKLRREGEYLGLVAPDGRVVSEYGTSDTQFPEQQANVSYGNGVIQKVKLIDATSDVMFWVPLDGNSDATWTQIDFDAAGSGFSPGKAAIGYESKPRDRVNFIGEFQTELPSRSHAVYVRLSFDLDDASTVKELLLRLTYDNGFIAYLNGVKVAEDNAPENPSWFSTAPDSGRRDVDVLPPVDINLEDHLGALVDGENVLAIHGLNYFPDNSDMLLVPELIGVMPGDLEQIGYMSSPTPGKANSELFSGFVGDTRFSVDRGFYDTPQQVEITSRTEGAEIYYTTNGSDPSPSNPDAARYTTALSIGATTTLRAAAFMPGLLPTNIDTHTYLFVDDVIGQTVMRNTITSDPVWGPQMRDSLLAIPTVSLVTPESISERTTIAQDIGTSVELIFPDGTEGFQVDAGIEHFGNSSLSTSKKNIRLSFKAKYGPSTLRYDLFGDGAADEFDQILLRTASGDGSLSTNSNRGTYLRNKWANDRELEMGQPSPHSRFVHVYINGTYWGIRQLMERPNAAFMATYFGGDKEDYDALNEGVPTDGDSRAWDAVRAATGDYDQLRQYLDMDNYVDYMLLQFYAGNTHWRPDHNWLGARKREEGAGWKFFSWDSDSVLRDPRANVINAGGPGDLWRGATRHEEFRILLADRAQKYFFNGGILTTDRVLAQFDELADEIRLPLIAETARWTGADGTPPYSPETWETHLERVRSTIIRVRTDAVIQQLRSARLLPTIDAPNYLVDGSAQHGGIIGRRSQLEMSAAQGTVVYTLDGSDPRLVGGAVSRDAIVYSSAIQLDRNVLVKARALRDGQWSALTEAAFQLKSEVGLRITEINYNPHPANLAAGLQEMEVGSSGFEFIELANVSRQPIDLDGVRLIEERAGSRDQGVVFQFATQTLEPGQRIVVASNRSAFQSRYGADVPVAIGNDGNDGPNGQYGGELSNDGERITLVDSRGGVIHQFDFAVGEGWPARAAGHGSSIEVVDTEANYNNPNNWRSSSAFGGSPGTAGGDAEKRIVINEVLAHGTAPNGDMVELYNTTSQAIDIGNWYLSNSQNDYFRSQFTAPTAMGPGEYQIFTEAEFGFGLDRARGDELWLIEADAGGRPVAFVDHVQFGPSAEGVSFGRWPNAAGPLLPMAEMTFGRPNAARRIGEVVISEIHYSPIDPDLDRPLRADQFEFVELYNRSDRTIDLAGWRLTGGIELTFSPGWTVEPEETLVVVSFDPADTPKASLFRFVLGADASIRLVGPFTGDLDDQGDSVRLEQNDIPPADDPSLTPYIQIDAVAFDVRPPWPTGVGATGNSLNRMQASGFGNSASSWTAQAASPGSVRFFARLAGDANEDGLFDQIDIVTVLQSGKYSTGEAATWSEGDFNGDGLFDPLDIVAALQVGNYVPGGQLDAVFAKLGR